MGDDSGYNPYSAAKRLQRYQKRQDDSKAAYYQNSSLGGYYTPRTPGSGADGEAGMAGDGGLGRAVNEETGLSGGYRNPASRRPARGSPTERPPAKLPGRYTGVSSRIPAFERKPSLPGATATSEKPTDAVFRSSKAAKNKARYGGAGLFGGE